MKNQSLIKNHGMYIIPDILNISIANPRVLDLSSDLSIDNSLTYL